MGGANFYEVKLFASDGRHAQAPGSTGRQVSSWAEVLAATGDVETVQTVQTILGSHGNLDHSCT
ncbi:hypothetical protein HX878_22230 [Pseudomonas veronii]|uniref:hypothetical protein n=1 Tax=Pseudomonas veronii TaxID=76761 RepID=UPI0015A22A78|nr:hypothetical protein [Pseudomonas veronii]NWD57445.1 hypothetical protein [Pseudomonas veronii]